MLWIVIAMFILFIIEVAFIIICEYRNPSKALAWLVIALLFPVAGFYRLLFRSQVLFT